jgi:acetylglutamate kinase
MSDLLKTGSPERPLVIKLGGRALDADTVPEFAADLALATGRGVPVVLVHGGGFEVTEWSRRLGHEPSFHEGRRVTDGATLEIVTAVLAGLANKRLVASLRAAGVDAFGMSALDGGAVVVEPHPDRAVLGEVGQVREIRAGLITALISHGLTPVIASVAAHGGTLLNVNADDVAAAVAAALEASELVLLSDAPGLVLEGVLQRRMTTAALDFALGHPDVQGGMRPKLIAARTAIEGGVGQVTIAAYTGRGSLTALLDGRGLATTIAAEPVIAAETAEAHS